MVIVHFDNMILSVGRTSQTASNSRFTAGPEHEDGNGVG